MDEEDLIDFKKKMKKKLRQIKDLEQLALSNLKSIEIDEKYDMISTKAEFTRFYVCIVQLSIKYNAIQTYMRLMYNYMLLEFATKYNVRLECQNNARRLFGG